MRPQLANLWSLRPCSYTFYIASRVCIPMRCATHLHAEFFATAMKDAVHHRQQDELPYRLDGLL